MSKTSSETLDELQSKIENLDEEISVYENALSNYLETRASLILFIHLLDNLLDDLDSTVNQEEVDRLIAYENGDAIRLTIQKMDNTSFSKFIFMLIIC